MTNSTWAAITARKSLEDLAAAYIPAAWMSAMAAVTSGASATGARLMSKPSAFRPLDVVAGADWPAPPSGLVAAII